MSKEKPVIRLNPQDKSFSKKYGSVLEAAEEHGGGVNSTLIARACRRNIKHGGYYWMYALSDQQIDHPHVTKLPNVLIMDIETAPMKVYVWGLFKQRINHDNIIRDWHIFSWAAKWLYESDVMGDVLTPDEAMDGDDERIVKSLWDVIEKADVVIAHNGIRFDFRRMNARFIMNGLTRPTPYQVIDTLKHAQSNFAFASHRLDYLSKLMFRKGKIETDFDLWKRCDAGDKEALEYMLKYNKEDVRILEEVYIEMRGWIKSHPNLALYGESSDAICPACMSNDLVSCGDYVTPAGKFEVYRCKNCGGVSRVRQSHVTPNERDRMRISVAR